MPKPTPKVITPQLRAQRAYVQRKRAQGLAPVTIWVPEIYVARIKEIERRLAPKDG